MPTPPHTPLPWPPCPAPQPGLAARRAALRRLGAWALASATPAIWAQTSRRDPNAEPPRLREAPESPPVVDPELVGLRSVLETAVRDAFAAYPDGWPGALRGHLLNLSERWRRLDSSYATPWGRLDALESLARHTAEDIWKLAGSTLSLEAHLLSGEQMRELQMYIQRYKGNTPWLTAWFESARDTQLYQRIVGLVIERHLAWLLVHRDRYLRNPSARHAQIEAEDWAICSGLARAWVRAIFDSIAAQERRLRADPRLAGSNQPMKAQLTRLGPAPANWPHGWFAAPSPQSGE